MNLWIDNKGVPCRVYKTAEATDKEILELAVNSGTFDFLWGEEEDIYTASDGELIHIEAKE